MSGLACWFLAWAAGATATLLTVATSVLRDLRRGALRGEDVWSVWVVGVYLTVAVLWPLTWFWVVWQSWLRRRGRGNA